MANSTKSYKTLIFFILIIPWVRNTDVFRERTNYPVKGCRILGKEQTIQGKKQQYIEYINVFSKTLMFQEKKPVYWANTLIYLAKQLLFLA